MKNISAASCFTACFCLVLLLSHAACIGNQEKPIVTQRVSGETILATIADNDKVQSTSVNHQAIPLAGNRSAPLQVTFSESGLGAAYIINKGGKVAVVHNNRKGKYFSAIGTVVFSSDGRRIAYAAQADNAWRMVIDDKEDRRFDALLTPAFSPDGQHIMYLAKEGDKWYIVVDNRQNVGTEASYATPEFSSDSTSIAYVETANTNDKMRLIVSDLTFGRERVIWSIGDLMLTANRDKTRIAATQVVGGKLRVIDLSFARPDDVHEGPFYDLIERLTFGDDGASVCYCALRDRTRLLVLDKREEVLPEGKLPELPVVRPDKKGVGVLLASRGRYFLHQAFYNRKQRGTIYDEAAGLVYSKDSRFYAYAARKGRNWFVVVNGKEGPEFDRVITPKFSSDNTRLVYIAGKAGKRFIVVADTGGRTVQQHPAYDFIDQMSFAADGKYIAYGVKEGNNLIWKVDGL